MPKKSDKPPITAELSFGEAERHYSLEAAVLIYKDNDHSTNRAATVHDIELLHNKPHLAAGTPVTMAAVERFMEAFNKQSASSFIPEQVVMLGVNRLAWWCPAGRRRIWFRPSDEKHKNLMTLNGKFVHHPPLLFVVGQRGGDGLAAHALTENKRPTPDTVLYRAPYWNLNDQGGMCRGNISLPSCSTKSIDGFERAFFNSAFSHTSGGLLTRHAAGHDGLWAELAALSVAPDAAYWKRNLVKTKRTLATLFQK
jgi:PRTRC genetic system protein B